MDSAPDWGLSQRILPIGQPTSSHETQPPLDETAPNFTVGATAALTPRHGMTQHALGIVVHRLDPFDPDKGPQGRFLLQQFAASARTPLSGKSIILPLPSPECFATLPAAHLAGASA